MAEETTSTATVNPNEPTSLLNFRFIRCIAIFALMNIVQFMMNPSISLAAQDAGADAALIGLIASVMGFTAFLFMIFAGPSTVAFPPHKLLCFVASGYAVSYFIISLKILPLFILARFIDGFVTSFQGPVMIMILTDCSPKARIATAMGFYGARNTLAKIVGPILGLNGIVLLFGYQVNAWVCTIAMVVAALVALTLPMKQSEFVPKKMDIRPRNIISVQALPIFFIFFFLQMTQMAMGNFNTVYGKTVLGYQNVGLMMSIGNICAIIIGPILCRFADSVGIRKVLIPILIVYGCAPIVIFNAVSFPMLCAGAIMMYIGFSVYNPLALTLLVKSVAPDKRGVAGNTQNAGNNLGSAIGPLLAGIIANSMGYGVMYYSLIVPVVLGIATILGCWGYITKNMDATVAAGKKL
ncbi:MAG: MFS transporter [Lachnospiraceae bacterium]|nr:MFS transporter [Lachnospiraceae bacterium]